MLEKYFQFEKVKIALFKHPNN